MSAPVAGPIFSAHREKLSGDHCSANRRCFSGMCSGTVVCRPGEWERTWLATRCPWWKSSTVWAVYRGVELAPDEGVGDGVVVAFRTRVGGAVPAARRPPACAPRPGRRALHDSAHARDPPGGGSPRSPTCATPRSAPPSTGTSSSCSTPLPARRLRAFRSGRRRCASRSPTTSPGAGATARRSRCCSSPGCAGSAKSRCCAPARCSRSARPSGPRPVRAAARASSAPTANTSPNSVRRPPMDVDAVPHVRAALVDVAHRPRRQTMLPELYCDAPHNTQQPFDNAISETLTPEEIAHAFAWAEASFPLPGRGARGNPGLPLPRRGAATAGARDARRNRRRRRSLDGGGRISSSTPARPQSRPRNGDEALRRGDDERCARAPRRTRENVPAATLDERIVAHPPPPGPNGPNVHIWTS